MDVTKLNIPNLADFFNHRFTDKNLKPRTIAGYRISVADGLGSAGQMVSQSLDLNHLLASFHRDRPSANRAFPNWDLSLVLLSFTWTPFEPLAKADLKGKKLLFVAIKKGYSKDISKAAIYSWIKQSIILAYQKSDQEVQNVSQVKGHQVRVLAASLAFKGGVALDEIMASCFCYEDWACELL